MNNISNEGKRPIYFGKDPQKKYLVVNSLDTVVFDKKDYRKTSIEIEQLVNTSSVLKRLAYTFNDLTLFMARNGIDFDQLSLSSITGVVCSESYYDELKNTLSSQCDEKQLDELYSKLPNETYSDVVPVTFKVDIALTGIDNGGIDLDSLSPEVRKKITEFEVSGLVHFNDLMVGLRDYGYSVDSMNGELFNYTDYLDMIRENGGTGTWFSVEVYYHNRKAKNDGKKL